MFEVGSGPAPAAGTLAALLAPDGPNDVAPDRRRRGARAAARRGSWSIPPARASAPARERPSRRAAGADRPRARAPPRPSVADSIAYPERQMTAAELMDFWSRIRLVAMATVGPAGQPHIAPVHAELDGHDAPLRRLRARRPAGRPGRRTRGRRSPRGTTARRSSSTGGRARCRGACARRGRAGAASRGTSSRSRSA